MVCFLVSFVKVHKILGEIACSFKSSESALSGHLAALSIRKHAGEVASFKFEVIS